MRVLFLYPTPDPKYNILRYHHGLGYISSILKKAGHTIKLRYIYRYNEKEISLLIDSFKPKLVGLSVTTNQFDLSRQVTRYIYRQYNLPVIWGGIHATVRPEESLLCEGVMAICLGEGEEACLEFVENMEKGGDYTSIRNFCFNINGQFVKNELRPRVKDLDELPFPDREVFNYQKLLNDYPQLEIFSGRGCPFNCTYCVNSYLNQIFKNEKLIRQRSVKNILMEIDRVRDNYRHIDTILFADDIFAVNKPWLKEFSMEYGKRLGIPFWCNMRADLIDEERIQYLKSAGCEQINIGIESGNDYIRKEIMKRDISREKIREAFNIVKKAGIRTWAFNMIGLPGETIDTIKETINLNREIRPDSIFCSIFHPYPGTALYDLCKKEGWISNRKVTSYFDSISILDLPTISQKDISYYYEIFKGLVFYPKLEGIIKWLAGIKIRPRKSLYAIIRDVDWLITRFISRTFSKKVKDDIKFLVKRFRNIMVNKDSLC